MTSHANPAGEKQDETLSSEMLFSKIFIAIFECLIIVLASGREIYGISEPVLSCSFIIEASTFSVIEKPLLAFWLIYIF